MGHSNNVNRGAVEEIFAEEVEDFLLEDYVGHLLRKASQRSAEIFQRVMRTFDVTPTQFAALVKLADEGEVSQNVLGRLTAMDPATILGVVSRLRRRNLVESRLDPSDGRRILLCLTDEGKSMVEAMREVAGLVTTEALSPLTKAESKTFMRLLHKLA